MATQRDYFQERITNMYETQIRDSLSKNPNLGLVTEEETEQALGIRNLCVQLVDLRERRDDLQETIRQVDTEIEAIIHRRFPDLPDNYRLVANARELVAAELTDKALAKTPEGRRVLGLKSKLKELQDRLHLANNTNDYKSIMEEAEKALKS